MNKKSIRDYDLRGKKVIIRVDFNVPIKDDHITDDNRIKESIPTIKYALDNGAKVILLSHLGRVKTEADLAKNDLRIVAIKLSELIFKPVKFINATRGVEVEDTINNMEVGDIVLLQNTRYEDLEDNKESGNDIELGKYWASLGDIFINDAFGTSHRAHASNVGIASNLPNGVGFLVEKELNKMLPVIENPEKPFTLVLGGAKVSDKIGLINNMIDKVDYILIGGGMSYTFLKAMGYNIGLSIVDNDSIDYVKELLDKYKNKIVLPVDAIVSLDIEGKKYSLKDINELLDNEIGLDIGPKTVELFKEYLLKSSTVIMNGPMGMFEVKAYEKGTKEVLSILTSSKTVIIGGGDTAAAAINMGYKDDFYHISTGGGASLELLAGKKLPGIEVINEK